MSEYLCSICNYTSQKREHVLRHQKRKKSCGRGDKYIIENKIDVVCDYCFKKFSCDANLKNHMFNSCKKRYIVMNNEIQELRSQVKNITNNNIMSNSNNNNNNNNNNNVVLVVNNYENTSLEKITDDIYTKILSKDVEPYQIIPRLIEKIHFNKDIPENHNIYNSNKSRNNKHLHVFRNGHWEITDRQNEISNIIHEKENNIGDWVKINKDLYPEAAQVFYDYLETRNEPDNEKIVKDEVDILLYNGKNVINK